MLVGLLVALVVAAAWITPRALGAWLRSEINDAGGRVEALDLRWFGSQSMRDLVLTDDDGRESLRLDVTVDHGMLAFLSGQVEWLRVHLHGTARVTLDDLKQVQLNIGGTPPADPMTPESGEGEASQSFLQLPAKWGGIEVRLDDVTLIVEDPASERTFRLAGFDGDLRVLNTTGWRNLLELELDGTMVTDHAEGPLKLAVRLDYEDAGDRGASLSMHLEGRDLPVPLGEPGDVIETIDLLMETDDLHEGLLMRGEGRFSRDGVPFGILNLDLRATAPGGGGVWFPNDPSSWNGTLTAESVPTAPFQPLLADTPLNLARDVGDVVSIDLEFPDDPAQRATVRIAGAQARLAALVQESWADSDGPGVDELVLQATIDPDLAARLGPHLEAPVDVTVRIWRFDPTEPERLENATVTLETPVTLRPVADRDPVVIDGGTLRVSSEPGGAAHVKGTLSVEAAPVELDLEHRRTKATEETPEVRHVWGSVEAIPVATLDRLAGLEDLLVAAVGDQATVTFDMAWSDTQDSVLEATIHTPVATAEGSLCFTTDALATPEGAEIDASLSLTPALRDRLLSGLGPVLADVRTVEQPIRATLRNAVIPTDGRISELHADLDLNVGAVAFDSGAATFQLLRLFNVSNAATVTGFIEPIRVRIRDGVVTYDRFDVRVGDLSLAFAGTVDLVTRKLDLRTTLPLGGLVMGVRELRGLGEDLAIPLLVRGTIDEPEVSVDPDVLGEFLMDAAQRRLLEELGVSGDGLEGELLRGLFDAIGRKQLDDD